MASPFSFFLFAVALLLVHSRAITEEVFQTEVEITPGFTYTGNNGPNKWGGLSPGYATCGVGKSQSPVNIIVSRAVVNKNLKPLARNYSPINATLVNHKFNVELSFGNGGVFSLDGKDYILTQMHWHTPSEHRINGVQHDAELHLVHVASDGSRAVIAVIYHIGNADPLIAKMQNQLANLTKEQRGDHAFAQITVGIFNTKRLERRTRKYFRYVGSLTTPPCSENVTWTILGKVRSISKEQVGLLRAPLQSTCKTNCRPVQPLNSRHVELYDETED